MVAKAEAKRKRARTSSETLKADVSKPHDRDLHVQKMPNDSDYRHCCYVCAITLLGCLCGSGVGLTIVGLGNGDNRATVIGLTVCMSMPLGLILATSARHVCCKPSDRMQQPVPVTTMHVFTIFMISISSLISAGTAFIYVGELRKERGVFAGGIVMCAVVPLGACACSLHQACRHLLIKMSQPFRRPGVEAAFVLIAPMTAVVCADQPAIEGVPMATAVPEISDGHGVA